MLIRFFANLHSFSVYIFIDVNWYVLIFIYNAVLVIIIIIIIIIIIFIIIIIIFRTIFGISPWRVTEKLCCDTKTVKSRFQYGNMKLYRMEKENE